MLGWVESHYQHCENKEAMVSEMGSWTGNGWCWDWSWAENPSPEEELNVAGLKDLL